MKDKLVKNAFRRSVGIFLTAAIVCGCTACSENKHDSSDNPYLAKTPTTLSTSLEKSKYQDFPSDVSGEEPVQLADGIHFVSSQVYATVDKDTYTIPDDAVVQFTVHNETGGTLSCAEDDFELEILLDDVWYVVPPTNYFFTDLALGNIGEEYTMSIDLSEIFVDYMDGTYRLLKNYGEEKKDGNANLLTSAEFQLTVSEQN